MHGSEEGRWKSTRKGNSLAAYPTACPIRGGLGRNLPLQGDKDCVGDPFSLTAAEALFYREGIV